MGLDPGKPELVGPTLRQGISWMMPEWSPESGRDLSERGMHRAGRVREGLSVWVVGGSINNRSMCWTDFCPMLQLDDTWLRP